jgi:uncharacterized protein YmfQ (DUF2313 family)
MAVTAEYYRAQLFQLRPPGPVWNWTVGGVLWNLALAIADGLVRLHLRIERLYLEADPRSTSELLPEWEATVGLPDGCIPGGGSTEQRRAAVNARLLALGGASESYFIGLAAAYGYTVTITYPAQHHWRVHSPSAVSITTFKAGRSRANDPLRSWGNQQLECLLNRVKPAHTVLEFAYGGA